MKCSKRSAMPFRIDPKLKKPWRSLQRIGFLTNLIVLENYWLKDRKCSSPMGTTYNAWTHFIYETGNHFERRRRIWLQRIGFWARVSFHGITRRWILPNESLWIRHISNAMAVTSTVIWPLTAPWKMNRATTITQTYLGQKPTLERRQRQKEFFSLAMFQEDPQTNIFTRSEYIYWMIVSSFTVLLAHIDPFISAKAKTSRSKFECCM